MPPIVADLGNSRLKWGRIGGDGRIEQVLALPLDDPDALWIHELIGSEVEDTDGRQLGTVEAIEANPASDLLVLGGGALIPLRFVVASEPGVRITVDVPDGLLDLS